MKKVLITTLFIFLGMRTVYAEPIVVGEQRLQNGEVIKMCTYYNGQYGYCTEEDTQKAINNYNTTVKNKTKIEKINTNISNTTNLINNTLNSVRTITSYWGI